MSRYRVESKASNYRVVVGWDASLSTFFGQVNALNDPDDLIYWIGNGPSKIRSVDQLIAAMADYAILDQQVVSALEQDQLTSSVTISTAEWVDQLIADALGDETC